MLFDSKIGEGENEITMEMRQNSQSFEPFELCSQNLK